MVLILLSTYNGSEYLVEFLSSLKTQTYTEWKLLVRDDNSNDNSLEIINTFFTNNVEKLSVIPSHRNVGAKESFNRLVCEAKKIDNYKYIMFADQDDVWKDDKIEITLTKMNVVEKENKDLPVLIHTDTYVTDAQLRVINSSLWTYENNNPLKNTLKHLLFQNTVTGCTMMVNKSLIHKAYPIAKDAIMHDWWFAMVASSFGKIGVVESATIYYRQHSSNTIGTKQYKQNELLKKIVQMLLLQNERYLIHLLPHRKQAKEFLRRYKSQLNQDKVEMLEFFVKLDTYNWLTKRVGLVKFGFRKQSVLQTISMFIRI